MGLFDKDNENANVKEDSKAKAKDSVDTTKMPKGIGKANTKAEEPPKEKPREPVKEDEKFKVFYCKRNIRFVIQPNKRKFDNSGTSHFVKGKHITIKNGRYICKNKAEEEFLTQKMNENPGLLYDSSPKKDKLLKALAMVEAEENKSQRRGKQGAAG